MYITTEFENEGQEKEEKIRKFLTKNKVTTIPHTPA